MIAEGICKNCGGTIIATGPICQPCPDCSRKESKPEPIMKGDENASSIS